jgi:hypothetical protein
MLAQEKAKVFAIADTRCFEFPVHIFLVQTAKLNAGLYREILIQFVFGYFHAGGFVNNTDVGIAHLPKVLAPVGCLVDSHHKQDLGDSRVNPVKVYADHLIVAANAVAAGGVVTPVRQRTVGRGGVSIKHKKFFCRN